MSFNISRSLTLLTLLLATSCGLHIGEKAPQDKQIQIGGSGFSCLSKIGERIEAFLDARLSDEQLRKDMGCIQYSFESFARRTRGQERNSYRPREIADFLEEYFLKDRKISNELLSGFMVIKQTLVGGTIDRVSHEDLRTAIDFIGFIRDQALRLNRHMAIYNFKLGRINSVDARRAREIDAAIMDLREVSEAIGNRLAKANLSYPLSHLESFMREFRRFSGWEEIFANSRDPHAWVTFLEAYKELLTGEKDGRIKPGEWAKLLSSSAGWYGVNLKLRYTQEAHTMLYGVGLEALVSSVNEGLRMARLSVDTQPGKVVTYEQMNRLIDSLAPVGLMPQMDTADGGRRTISSEGIKGVLRAVLNRVFGDRTVPWNLRQVDGLNSKALAQMAEEFSAWTRIQNFLEKTFAPSTRPLARPGDRLDTLVQKLTLPIAGQKVLKPFSQTMAVAPPEILRVEKTMRPLFRPFEGRIFLTEDSSLVQYGVVHGFHNLSTMNVLRSMLTLLMRGYSSSPNSADPMDQGVTSDELQAFYMDFRPFGVDMQLFDPRSTSAGQRAFREANMFTYSADGFVERQSSLNRATLMNFFEGIEISAFIYSGGQLGRDVYSRMMNPETGVCYRESANSPISVHGYPMISRDCFRRQLMAQLIPSLSTMPTMLHQVTKAKPAEVRSLADGLIETAYSAKFNSPKWVEWNEVTTIAVIMHYSEAVMTRYNRDGDTILNTDEVWNAYGTFAGFMNMMVRQKCEDVVARMKADQELANGRAVEVEPQGFSESWRTLKGWIRDHGCSNLPSVVNSSVFAYLVRYGKVPSGLIDIDLRARLPLVGYDFEVDRVALIKVFSALVKASAEAPAK